MKMFFILLIIVSISIAKTYANNKKPSSIDYLNAKKFSGLWYEIARTYNSFERNCVGASVEYTLIEPFKYQIKNRCFDKTFNGKLIEYNGIAKPSNGTKMSELDMTYFWIFTKEYKIVYLDENYQAAVLIDNDMQQVWIINREPFMKKEKLNIIVASLKKYIDISKLIYTPQDKRGKYK